jgi:hypothetical protein
MNWLICTNKDFTIIRLEKRVRSILWPAYYLKLSNGYWYNLDLAYGMMLRVKHVEPVKVLNRILTELAP